MSYTLEKKLLAHDTAVVQPFCVESMSDDIRRIADTCVLQYASVVKLFKVRQIIQGNSRATAAANLIAVFSKGHYPHPIEYCRYKLRTMIAVMLSRAGSASCILL